MRDLVYNGTAIGRRDEMVSLTDMWKAKGRDPSRRPVDWIRSADAKRFMSALSLMLNVEDSHLLRSVAGRYGGTFAHWQVGMAYAKFLSPNFHIWYNTVVREVMEGRLQVPPRQPQQEELALQPPTFEVEGITKADLRTLCQWIEKKLSDHEKQVVAAVWHAKGSLNRSLLSPEHLAEKGIVLLPAPTPDANFLTATQVCWRVVPDERLHAKMPGYIASVLSTHAGNHQWPQGLTPRVSRGNRQLKTFPESRVEEWLAAGGAALIEHENDRLRQESAIKAGALPLRETA